MNSKVSTSSISLDRKWNPFDGSDMKRCYVNSRIASYKKNNLQKDFETRPNTWEADAKMTTTKASCFFLFLFQMLTDI